MPKIITGTVSSSKPDKTIIVTAVVRKTHPLYRKQYSVSTKYAAHDERNEAKEGDRVQIKESKPISARKRFTLVKILDRADIGFSESDATGDIAEVNPAAEKTEDNQK